MKVPLSVRNLYLDQVKVYEELQQLVDKLISSKRNPRWHYESRVKQLESFAQKLETGRFDNPKDLEDFFACTIVVNNFHSIKEAEDLICSLFTLKYRRPQEDSLTHKSPESFVFDDLRLYVEWIDDETLPPSGLLGKKFECQIKTFLQHAWSISTHDLIYKNDNLSWARQRVAFQVKAMLEHAESAVAAVDEISEVALSNKTDRQTQELIKIINLVKSNWEQSSLPQDIIRLSKNIQDLLKLLDLNSDILAKILIDESKAGRGKSILNLSPYGIIIQSIIHQKPDVILNALSARNTGQRRRRFPKIFIPDEIDLPSSFRREELVNAIWVVR
ncbi:MAG: hypothetical protein IV090_20540 [Candidatus Sericytochromatia bacterium]|nr:hypothetical protein [Candidatus Sericytochromatia bacterium]